MREIIEQNLLEKLKPEYIEIQDDSHLHAGHTGQKLHGGSHFSILVVSEMFEGVLPLQRHRMVYSALDDGAFDSGKIHALKITALSPKQWHNHKLLR